MTSLTKYSKAIFEASQPRSVDFEISFSLGEYYATKLSHFINNFWPILDFECTDNGVEKIFDASSLNGPIKIIIVLDPIHQNKVIIDSKIYGQTEATYSSYEEFTKIIDILTTRFYKIKNARSPIIQCNSTD